jgi:mono/diheme cytochrome c family protein
MKKSKKGFSYTVVALMLIVVIGLSYVTIALPNVGQPENIKVELTPQRIARGSYLANHVTVCVDCHSRRDWTKFAGPMKDISLGGGGELFNAAVGFPGTVHVSNITPYSLKKWSDGEIFRAITCGVRKNGDAIFPLMPWPYYSKMNREDIYSIIAYLRTLKPIQTTYPKSTLDFPLNILVHTMPEKAALGELPSPADTIKYGKYMATSSACMECHTKEDKGKQLPGMQFAGGHEFTINGNTIRSANITPDNATGIGTWTRDAFVERFKLFTDPSKATHTSKNDYQTIMPWYDYGGMSENDLKSIYAYLRTVKPVSNKVVKFQVNNLVATNGAK